jgi:tetratricopeptide (TPR) repeat protein
MELAERLNDPELLSVCLDAAAFWVAPEARYGEMYRLQTRRVQLVPRLLDVTEACDCLGSACWAAYFAGHYRETIVYADECLERADGVDAGNYQHALQWRLIARFTLGDWDEALEDQALLESMVEREVDGPIPVFLASAYSHILLCHELRGNKVRADAYLKLLKQLKVEIGEDMGLPRVPTAMTMLHRGLLDEARTWLTLEDMSMSLGPVLEAMCALAPEEGDDEASAALADIVRNDVKRMESPSLVGHLERLDGRLLHRAGRPEAAVTQLESSIGTFAELGALWEEALSRLHLGEVFLHVDRPEEAERELRRSLDVFTKLGSVTEVDRAAAALASL